MCGIAGVILNQGQNLQQQVLDNLADAMAHRGPDGRGFFLQKNVGLVHVRLSIIDVAGGAQPLKTQDKKQTLVANGEIYNFKNLQKWCLDQGTKLNTKSDCEPPLYLYRKYGMEFVKYLEGMYAIAVYDDATGDVILARDSFGIKPLYYAKNNVGFAFASEPAVLTKAGWIRQELNQKQVYSFFSRQYVGGEETLFKGIYRLKPGEVIRVNNGKIVERRRFQPQLEKAKHQTEDNALKDFGNIFGHAVTTHLQSDVPYGAFLSGGIDSSTLVTEIAEQTKDQISTFTIGFESNDVADERQQGEKLANQLKCKHNSVSFSEKDFWKYLPQATLALDDLVADYAALPVLKLAEEAKKHVKVILSGEGGDEAFAGYSRYRRGGLLDFIRGRKFRGKGDAAYFPELWKQDIAQHKALLPELPYDTKGWTRLQRYQALDMQDWLPDDLLTKVDRCLMVHGIEGRVPFLDTKVATFGFSLPDKLKFKAKHGKWLVKRWLSRKHGWINVFQKKKGFTVPVAEWLENKHDAVVTVLLENEGLGLITNEQALKQFVSKPFKGRRGKMVFSMLCFALWYNTHILNNVDKQKVV